MAVNLILEHLFPPWLDFNNHGFNAMRWFGGNSEKAAGPFVGTFEKGDGGPQLKKKEPWSRSGAERELSA
jgi:hypothetical protein